MAEKWDLVTPLPGYSHDEIIGWQSGQLYTSTMIQYWFITDFMTSAQNQHAVSTFEACLTLHLFHAAKNTWRYSAFFLPEDKNWMHNSNRLCKKCLDALLYYELLILLIVTVTWF